MCIGCGAAPAFDQLGRVLPCACLPDGHLEFLEQQAHRHRVEFAAARLLSMGDLKRWVGDFRVEDVVRWTRHDGAFRESEFRVTDAALVQLVYLTGKGSRLVKWEFR